MTKLEQLIELRKEINDKILKNEYENDSLTDEMDEFDDEIAKINRFNSLNNNQSISDKLVGKAFVSKYDSNCIYKIKQVLDIDPIGITCKVIRLTNDIISYENYFHYLTNGEIDVTEFDAKFDTVVASLIQINKLKK